MRVCLGVTSKLLMFGALNVFLLGGSKTIVSSFSATRAHIRRSSLAPSSFALAMVSSISSESTDARIVPATCNPFLDQATLPKFSLIEPKDLLPAVELQLDQMNAEFKDLEGNLASASKTEYDDVLPVLERLQFPLSFTWGVAGHLNGVKNGEELRQAYESAQPKVVKAFMAFSQSKVLFDSLSRLYEQEAVVSGHDFKDQQRRRAVEKSLKEMTLGGVGLEGEQKERFNEIKVRLSELATKFSNNVLDSTKAFSLTITEAAQVDGVPPSAKAMWAQAYFTKQQKDNSPTTCATDVITVPDPEKGPWLITLDGPSYIAAMQHIKDRATREQLYRAYLTRASDLEDMKEADVIRNNVPLIQEILQLRLEAAELLGYRNHAEKSLATKMAPSVEAVKKLSDLIAAKALPMAYTELEAITSYAREHGGEEYSTESKLMPWDVTFWSERFKEAKFDLKEEDLLPYFAFEAVLDGLFSLVERIFAIEVKPADGEAEVWHKDARFFNVYDKVNGQTGEHMASFYLDPYSRPADKRGGAWMDVCIGKSEACGRNIPVAYLTCNGRPPVGDHTPSLMTFREVETLFHEFGHGLQHMLTRATVGDVAGINGIEWDAVELPSQFMENWCYHKPTVCTCHEGKYS
jgi:oligopeptidase A